MAQKYKIRRKKKSAFSKILPESFQAFIARRVIDGTGAVMAVSGILMTAAILSYNHRDPSLNAAASGAHPVSNWLGGGGAVIADILMQTLGAASLVFGAALAVWGLRIVRRLSVTLFWGRMTALIFGALMGAMALARVPSGDWLVHPYLGGSAGSLMLSKVASAFSGMGLPYAHTVSAVIAGLLGIAALSFALMVGWHGWRMGLAALASAIKSCALLASSAVLGFFEWVRHYGDSSYISPRKQAKVKKQPVISPDPRDEDAEDEDDEEQDAPADDEDEHEEEDDYDDEESGEEADSNVLAAPIKVVKPQAASHISSISKQTRFQLFDGGEWELPALDLLQEGDDQTDKKLDENALRMNAELLQNVLGDFNVKGEIVSIHPGPVVTLYELEPAPGVKSSRVIGLADDIARSMSAVSVRAAVVPGRNVIGIEIPNKKRQFVYLRDLLSTREYEKTKASLPLVLGKDIGGQPIIADLARMPHLLVAGTTGSGKSVAVNTMILSLLFRLPPEKCRFIMIDPKMLELSVYDDIPHLLSPVVTEPGRAIVALKWVVAEMEERYRCMSKLGVRNIEGYNQRLAEARRKGEVLLRKVQTGFDPETGKPVYEEQPLDLTELPFIVVIVDEFADLMLVAGKEVENAIQRLAQMARAAGIHLIMATQRPSVDVITGVIKANFPTRISFAVTSRIDSRTILGEGGAEQLLGMGDMLYMAAGGRITRVHGPFSSDEDVENVVNFLKSQGEPAYLDDITDEDGIPGGLMDMYGGGEGGTSDVDDLYDQAVAIVAREGKASTSFIQRHLQIGYNRAARIIEEMERQGVISPASATGKRRILVGDHSE